MKNRCSIRFLWSLELSLALGLPIDCTLGSDCHILAYIDKLPGPAYQDMGGGRQTYDGHDGTDFGIADESVMQRGVVVKAAAAGTVVRVRDGVADRRVENPVQAEAVNSAGCGNAVVIEHPDAWRTYYCHLRQGSVAVKAGMQVEKGAALGLVGSSGLASYPHMHFGVLHRGRKIDPFTGLALTEPWQPDAKPLWDTPISYAATGLIRAGFSSQPPDINAVWKGAASVPSLTTAAPSLTFWVHPFGVLMGDVEKLRLLDPGGQVATETTAEITSANRINRVSSLMMHNTPAQPLRAGTWAGHYQLWRQEQLLMDTRHDIEVSKP